MNNVHFERHGAALACEEVKAEIDLRREVDCGGIARGNIGAGEEGAAGHSKERRDFLEVREVPFPEERLDAAAVDAAIGRKNNVDRYYFDRPLEIAAQNSRKVFSSKNQTAAATGDQKLRIVR